MIVFQLGIFPDKERSLEQRIFLLLLQKKKNQVSLNVLFWEGGGLLSIKWILDVSYFPVRTVYTFKREIAHYLVWRQPLSAPWLSPHVRLRTKKNHRTPTRVPARYLNSIFGWKSFSSGSDYYWRNFKSHNIVIIVNTILLYNTRLCIAYRTV